VRAALLQSRQKLAAGVAVPVHLPAPTGGWNTRDTLAALPITDAVRLTNFFPASLGEVVTRGGSFPAAWNIGPAAAPPTIRSLYQYGQILGFPRIFAVADTGIYDISAGGDQANADPEWPLTDGYWNAVQMTNSIGQTFLWGCNGKDRPALYDGALQTWAEPVVNGAPNPENFTFPFVFKRRIWCVEKDSMSVWYSEVDSIQGMFYEFPVGALFTRGGWLVAGASWTIDGGSGPDDFLVLITSQGEVAIYQGIDPASASGFSIIGVFFVGAPLGRRCFVKYGGDLVILTEQGAFPLSSALKSAVINYAVAISSKIQPTFILYAGLYRDKLGWEATIYPNKNALLINIPVVPVGVGLPIRAQQLVMNTLTGAWCDFDGWNATCFTLFMNELYFGTEGGKVFKAWSTEDANDDGYPIVCTGQTAFSYLSKSAGLKTVDAVRPLLAYDEKYDLAWGLAVDFEFPAKFTGFASSSLIIGQAIWDEATWDLSAWSLQSARQKLWRTPSCRPGYAFSLILRVTSGIARVAWSGHDFLVNTAGPL